MGYIRHDAVIAIGYISDPAEAEALKGQIDDLRAEMGDEAQVLIGPIPTVINGDTMYVYLPDGSKEGWNTSHQHDEWRDRFKAIIARQRWWDVLALRFGGDDAEHIEAEVTNGSDVVANANLWA